jgi:hypothetical protein
VSSGNANPCGQENRQSRCTLMQFVVTLRVASNIGRDQELTDDDWSLPMLLGYKRGHDGSELPAHTIMAEDREFDEMPVFGGCGCGNIRRYGPGYRHSNGMCLLQDFSSTGTVAAIPTFKPQPRGVKIPGACRRRDGVLSTTTPGRCRDVSLQPANLRLETTSVLALGRSRERLQSDHPVALWPMGPTEMAVSYVD